MSEQGAKKPWGKPTLTVHRSGLLNKAGVLGRSQWREDIDGVPVADLVEAWGSPLFVISEQRLRQNARRLQEVFSHRYPRLQLAWSYKTNYLGAVCNIFHQEGAWAEVVSQFEYEKARALGVAGQHIVFNGPHKHRQILARAIDDGARINIDHLDELYLLEELAQERRRSVDVAIRLNFDTVYTEPWSRFGFNVESGQALDAAWRIAASDWLNLVGLHSHIGTFILDARAYNVQVRTLCRFMAQVEEETGCAIEFLDIGGGFASANALQGIYLPPSEVVPTLEQYAEAVCEPLLQATHGREARGRRRPLLILETGRALVDDAEVLLAQVVANKRLPDGRRGLVLDAGVNVLFTAFWYNHEIVPSRPAEGAREETVVYGPLCMNIDVIRASVMLPPLNVGDTVVLSPAGAYNNTQWLQFIEYRPNVVLVHEGRVSLVRQAEDLAAVTAQERLPEHLRQTQTADKS